MYAYRETAARFRTRGKDTRKNGKLEYRIYPLADYSPIRSLFDGNPDSNPPITSSEASNIRFRRLDIGWILLRVGSDIATRPRTLRVYREAYGPATTTAVTLVGP
jgi:hypothetical protein